MSLVQEILSCIAWLYEKAGHAYISQMAWVHRKDTSWFQVGKALGVDGNGVGLSDQSDLKQEYCPM